MPSTGAATPNGHEIPDLTEKAIAEHIAEADASRQQFAAKLEERLRVRVPPEDPDTEHQAKPGLHGSRPSGRPPSSRPGRLSRRAVKHRRVSALTVTTRAHTADEGRKVIAKWHPECINAPGAVASESGTAGIEIGITWQVTAGAGKPRKRRDRLGNGRAHKRCANANTVAHTCTPGAIAFR